MSKLLILLIILGGILISFSNQIPNQKNTFGVTFSPMYAKYLGLDWQKTYLDMLDNLKVKYLRIPTYWSVTETDEGKFNFDEVDFMVDEAGKRDAQLIMVVGIKQPRWPECHTPSWARNLPIQDRQQKALNYIEQVITRYAQNPTIISWQVENEPLWRVNFGEYCDKIDANFLQSELDLVKRLDSRSIILTDSGEWSSWRKPSQKTDILGVSLYRKAYNPTFGYITYPFPAWMYSLKAKLVGKEVFIVELQAEPWAKSGIPDTSIEEQLKLFSPSDLKDAVDYAKKTNLSEIYFWGLEWWYYMATKGHFEYLNYAQSLF